MPNVQPSLLFNRYDFSEEEIIALKHLMASPLIKAYIAHLVAGQIEQHVLTPMLSLSDNTSLRDSEMFTKGVIQLGMELLENPILGDENGNL